MFLLVNLFISVELKQGHNTLFYVFISLFCKLLNAANSAGNIVGFLGCNQKRERETERER